MAASSGSGEQVRNILFFAVSAKSDRCADFKLEEPAKKYAISNHQDTKKTNQLKKLILVFLVSW
jgi:hypothetical protein